VAKCGTTSLHEWLSQYDEIDLPKLKETKYFTSNKDFGDSNIESWSINRKRITEMARFIDQFSWKDDAIRGEICPEYFYSNELFLERHKKIGIGDPKILILLRDPAARAISAWKYLIRDSRTMLGFDELWNSEYKESDDYVYDLRNGGLYAEKVKFFFENYSDVKVVFFEELVSSISTQRKLLKWLDVEARDDIKFPNSNISVNIQNRPIIKLLLSRRFRITVYIREILKRIIPSPLITKFFELFYKKDKVSENIDVSNCKEFYRKDIIALERIIGYKVPDKWIK
jgi:hypothetical protein